MLKDQYGEFFIEKAPDKTEKGQGEQEKEAFSLYKISPEMKPSFIPMRVAEKIPFIGEAVKVFSSKEISRGNCSQVEDKTSQAASRLLKDQLRYTTLLSELRDQKVFNLRIFESTCGQIRDSVAENLKL